MENNDVVIGGERCIVTSATTTELKCNIGQGPAGTYRVMINVAGKGYAKHDAGNIQFKYKFQISAISPTSGSRGGESNFLKFNLEYFSKITTLHMKYFYFSIQMQIYMCLFGFQVEHF